jgi:hypothetical protein
MKIRFSKSNLVVATAFFFIAVLGIIGCKKTAISEPSPAGQRIELTGQSFNFIGEAHNKALDYIFEKTFSVNPNTSYADVIKSVDEYVFEINPETKRSKDDRSFLQSQEFKQNVTSAIHATSLLDDNLNLKSKLTPAQFEMVRKLDAIFSEESYEKRIKQIENLEAEAIHKLNDNEIVYILAVTNLAKHSMEYWNSEKGQLWLTKIKGNLSVSVNNTAVNSIPENRKALFSGDINWRDVAKADVIAFGVGFPAGVQVGALVGGVTAGIASGGITAGLGAVLGGIVGGTASGLATAIAASGLALAAEVITSWFW